MPWTRANKTPRPSRNAVCLLLISISAQVLCYSLASGEERIQRRHDQIPGSTTASIFGIAQDEDGFLWVAIEGGGLARFDGREFRRWAQDKLTTHILFARAAGEPLALIVEPELGSKTGNSLYRILGDTAEPIPGPDGTSWVGVKDAAYDGAHRLWVARVDDIYRLDDSSNWIRMLVDVKAGDRIRRLAPNRSGGMFVITTSGVQSIDSKGTVSQVVRSHEAADAIDRGDGSILYVEMKPTGGAIFEIRDGRSTELTFVSGRFNRFVQRGRTTWADFDIGVVAFRGNEPPELLGPAEGMPGGVAFVDREGSFWAGTAEGLVQIPEPETTVWGQRDGLPIPSARYLAKTDEGLWIATWGGLCRLALVNGKWQVVVDEKLDHKWPLMADRGGKLWGKHEDTFIQRVVGRFRRYAVPNSGVLNSVAHASDGTLWLGTDNGLFKTNRSESTPISLLKPTDVGAIHQVFEDSRGTLWVASDNRICHASATAVASGGGGSWVCDEIDRVPQFSRIMETPGGSLWASRCIGGGVWCYDNEGRWKMIPASQNSSDSLVTNMVPSRSGGIWILGSGSAKRVAERSDLKEGWEVLEEISVWQGLPATTIADLIEDADGTLWIATAAGVVRIREDARRARPEPPRIKQTAFIVNGLVLESEGAPKLAHDSKQIELQFAALSYRSPGSLKYQYRLRPEDVWTDSSSGEPVFRFFDLRPGKYSAEVRASLDGTTWSQQPARFDFEVLSPWYFRWWAVTGLVLILVLVLVAAHRARVAVLLGLERQRSMIAMDLHDEIGSGLGSIGILSGVAASGNVKDDERRELARNIVETTSDLGNALTDIVWSLRPDSGGLEGLAYRLAQRASRLFPDGSPEFKTEFPSSWPRTDLSLAARHNLLLIASEAMYNAARHANAKKVVLGISPEGRAWRLWIADDGCGMRTNGDAPNGLGLISMRKRAEQIGADISWSSDNGVGTMVTVKFAP